MSGTVEINKWLLLFIGITLILLMSLVGRDILEIIHPRNSRIKISKQSQSYGNQNTNKIDPSVMPQSLKGSSNSKGADDKYDNR